MRRLVTLAALLSLAVAAPAHAKTERPLVYVVVVDGLDGDRVDAGDAPFISSLMSGHAGGRGTYYPESRSVMITETNPNHVAMMTGAYGGASGIFSNVMAVYHPVANEDSCTPTGPVALDKMPREISGENADCLRAETVFAAIDKLGNPDGLLTAFATGKPKLGRIFAGKTADPAKRDVDFIWAPCASGADDDEYCGDVPTNPVSGYAFDDATVMDQVLRTIDEGIGPEKRRPDLTFVNLHQVDSAGHAFAPGAFYDAAIGMADQEIQRLVQKLQERNEWSRTVMILLSDHAMDSQFAKVRLSTAFEGAGVPADKFLALGKAAVEFVYLADRTAPDRFALLKQLRATALAQDGVQEALYREANPQDGTAEHTIAAKHPDWRLDGERIPDLLVTAVPGTGFNDPDETSQPLPGHHGGPPTRDNFFAVVGGGAFVQQAQIGGVRDPIFDDTLLNPQSAENVDVAATVMGLFGLPAPRDNAGRFLAEAFDVARLPGAGRPAITPPLSVKARRSRRFTVRAALPGAVYDLEVQVGRGWKRLRTASAAPFTRHRVRRSARRGRFRARILSAAGVRGPWVTRTVRARR